MTNLRKEARGDEFTMITADMKRYHKWVSEQPCVHCGLEGYVQVAHYTGMDGHMLGRGMGKKAHHLMVCPLCSESGGRCHQIIENHEQYTHPDEFTRKIMHSSLMYCYIAMTQIRAYETGVLEVG